MSLRSVRALQPSDDLLRGLTMCGSTLIGGFDVEERSPTATVSLATLKRVEEEIGAVLHDDLLTLVAVADPVARLLTGIEDLNSIADAADEATGVPDGFICVAMVYSDPVGEQVAGHHGAAYLYLAAERRPVGEVAQILVARDGFWEAAEQTTLGAFIDTALHEARSGEVGEAITGGAPREHAEPLEPAPELVPGRELRLTPVSTAEKISHPKFGLGEVVRWTGDGDSKKVTARFEDKERTLLARFVQVVDG